MHVERYVCNVVQGKEPARIITDSLEKYQNVHGNIALGWYIQDYCRIFKMMVRFAVCFFWKACSNCCFFARSVAEIHSGFHASCMETHYPLIFQLNFMTITLKWHIWPRLLWHEVALQCHASCLAGFAFHGFHAGTWWPKASSHRTHSRLNIFFSSPHNSKNSLLMIGRNESKMTYPPCRFQQSLQQWHAVKKKRTWHCHCGSWCSFGQVY